ncbi:unnamed protein product [Phytophthora fragariaefolia]|uniref:Unnamed protein product n=1 Tax=Phytophthora fragariaefolia TaxID=1490495 RepID=A0A9W6XQ69_9STRA|nr:unnamed protein product [Phytophthora fragariaefolia]
MATFDDQVCYIAVYVDDLLTLAPTVSLVCRIKSALKQRFSMTDLGEVKYILGWSIERNREARTIFIHQQKYATNVLDKFKHLISYPTATPLDRNIKLTKAMEPQTQVEREAMKDIVFVVVVGGADPGICCASRGQTFEPGAFIIPITESPVNRLEATATQDAAQ